MAEKAKAKKAKTLSKKTSAPKAKKREEHDQEEVLELQAEEMPKRSPRAKASAPAAEKPGVKAPETKEAKVAVITPVVQPSQAQTGVPLEAQATIQPRQDYRKTEVENDGLRLRLSQSLIKKLKDQAADEGISLEEFVGELLAESVVLRAWEIVERKNAMKGPSHQGAGNQRQGHGNHQGGNRNNQGGGNRNNQGGGNQGGNKGHRGMSHVRYQTIMDDKATFLEYVRNQEKMRR